MVAALTTPIKLVAGVCTPHTTDVVWLTDSTASQYTTLVGKACNGRNEICAKQQAPCTTAADPAGCAALCSQDSTCISYEWIHTYGGCQMSTSCTAELSSSFADYTLGIKKGDSQCTSFDFRYVSSASMISPCAALTSAPTTAPTATPTPVQVCHV